MPQIHKLFLGGNRTQTTHPPMMFPQQDVLPDQEFETDNRRGPVHLSPSRLFAFQCSRYKQCPTDCFNDALFEYLQCNEFADGDIIETHILPRRSSLIDLWWCVDTPKEGITGEISVRGTGEVLGTIDFSAEGSGIIPIAEPIYFEQNDMLQLTLSGAVDNEAMACLCFMISPVMREYCRGFDG